MRRFWMVCGQHGSHHRGTAALHHHIRASTSRFGAIGGLQLGAKSRSFASLRMTSHENDNHQKVSLFCSTTFTTGCWTTQSLVAAQEAHRSAALTATHCPFNSLR